MIEKAKNKIGLPFIFFLWMNPFFIDTASSQELSNLHKINILPFSDTLQLDSLSIVPKSLVITTKQGIALDSSFYSIDYVKSTLFLNRQRMNEEGTSIDTLYCSYRTFPFSFAKIIQHKDIKNIRNNPANAVNPFQYVIEKPATDLFKMDGLTKNGSISRGINFGNNQDVVVNSNLNLQVAGKLSDNVDVLIAATDNSIPIQPEGNTQQLQEFDKVFIQVNDKKSKLIAGDYQTSSQDDYFLRFNKKAQGANFATAFETNGTRKDPLNKGSMSVTGSAAISRGKFSRNVIQGIERNQGPYFLKGAENEQFIIVLSGSERVYIDGELLLRGQQNDYIIDYNTAQVIFTARRLITKDKRIVVEFQYSDRNFARSLYHIGNEFKQNNLKIRLNAYSEQDSKNKPFQQELTNEQKIILAATGDDLDNATAPGIDSVSFSKSEVLYAKVDTTINSILYKNVYVYTTDSAKAYYRVNFSQVPKGNYKQISSSVNGKVFQWVEPIGGEPQGNYEPVIKLISAKQRQMLDFGIAYKINKNTNLNIETAISNNDINTFSSIDKANDVGYGVKFGIDNVKHIQHKSDSSLNYAKTWKVVSNVNYEYVQQNFNPIERFRAVEFERDWNRLTTFQLSDQHIAGAGLSIVKPELFNLGYHFNSFLEGSYYNAFKQGLTSSVNKKGFNLFFDGSLMNSNSTYNTSFLRHNGKVSQNLGFVTIGVFEQQEHNEVREKNSDTLTIGSRGFFEWTGFATNSDTSKIKYMLSYKQRNDFALRSQQLQKSTFAQETTLNINFLKNYNNQLNITTTYRTLTITDTLLSLLKPDQTLLGRVEHNLTAIHGLLNANTFYEIGSGQEVKKEFSYVEVAAGQGVYAWTDYNSNEIKELNEFEVAVFKDQARYIKIYTPTNQTITAYSNQFSESLNLRPAAIWSNKKGVRRVIALFANQTTYRVDKKTTDNNLENAYNPFYQSNTDSSLKSLNSALRNSVFFNQLSPIFGIDYNYQDVRNKSLLTNGIETRATLTHEIKIRWNITRVFSINTALKNGNKYNNSEFFSTRNYNISINEVEPKVSFQPNTSFRLSLIFKYNERKNTLDLGGQKSVQQNYGTELRYNILQKGSLNFKANIIQIEFNDTQNSPIAYEMLEGLKTGQNITWGVSYQQNLANNLTISINYDGRQSENSKAIHTGGAQVRAYF